MSLYYEADNSTAFDAAAIPIPPLHGCQIRAEMSFAEAAATFDEWLSCPLSPDQARYRSKGTMRDNRTKIKALNKFFGSLKLRDIHIGQIREYQKMRFSNERNLWAHPAGADKINQEMGLQLRIMRLGNAYTSDIEKYYQSLQVDECEIPKALSQVEQERFLEVAASRPEWEVVYWYSLLAVHIAFSSDEIRTLRQGDINLTHQIVAVNRRAGKNKYRRREVPLTDGSCIWALDRLLERSYRLAGKSPEMHLFPFRLARNQFDGSYHMGETGIRKQFEAIRDAAGVPWFNLNGWRHTAITRMAEAGIPIATIMARAGHCSPKMTAHYTHVSMQAERLAMQSMTRGGRVTPKLPWRPQQQASIDLMNPTIEAEIDRRVALALEDRRDRARTLKAAPQEVDSREAIRDNIATPVPSAPNVVSFPGPRRA
jgi:integrase